MSGRELAWKGGMGIDGERRNDPGLEWLFRRTSLLPHAKSLGHKNDWISVICKGPKKNSPEFADSRGAQNRISLASPNP